VCRGFVGYEVGAPLPTLTQILDGAPLANSPPVTVIAVPGSAYHYSGGGYEIAEALTADTLHAPFPEAMDALVLKPAQMTHSTFVQPLPSELAAVAAKGHYGDGNQLLGQGLVVMTNSDNGSILAEALIRRVAQLYRWPPIGVLPD
jgi:CubicO group peptidase (beta-lactamase class C family)